MKQRIHSRQFEVDFYELNESLWQITSRLNDDIHDIRAVLDISVPDMQVQAASVEFVRYPLQECLCIPAKIQGLVGANLFSDYSQRARQLFLGPGGCPNVMNLLTTSAPALIYFYFPDQIAKGKLQPEAWWQMCATTLVDTCLAHQMMAPKNRLP